MSYELRSQCKVDGWIGKEGEKASRVNIPSPLGFLTAALSGTLQRSSHRYATMPSTGIKNVDQEQARVFFVVSTPADHESHTTPGPSIPGARRL
jgi:hypothetical protein